VDLRPLTKRLPEPLIIRPPTEAGSVLLRVTRGCNWNRCRFCGIYTHLGQPDFETRPLEETLADVEIARDAFGPDAAACFLGDADPLIIAPDEFIRVCRAIRAAFPRMERITCYARSATLWMRRAHLGDIAAAGLSRVHVGLETGADELLRYHRKGVSQRRAIEAGKAARTAGLELSYYVLLGLGGADRAELHVRETVKVLNAVRPQFVRFRRLWISGSQEGPACPLYADVCAGAFTPQTPEGTVREMRAIIAGADFATEIEAIHHNVCVRLAGQLPQDRQQLLARIDAFLALPGDAKAREYSKPLVI
jgi:radical SAM superfamily enzyme YgiQ (UPF0313 family)